MENSHIFLSNNLSSFRFQYSKIEACIRLVLDHLNLSNFSVSLSFCGNQKIKSLNLKFRNKNKVTDVLSFPQNTWKSPVKVSRKNRSRSKFLISNPLVESLGDIIISVPQAQKNAKKIGQNLDREVVFLIVHSILHLCGHDHESVKDEKIMLKEQRLIMKKLDALKFWKNCVVSKSGRIHG